MIRIPARLLLVSALGLGASAQTLVVDRALGSHAPIPQPIERPKGAFVDAFRIGNKGEVWMIDSIRVWAYPDAKLQKVALFGALDNPPVPGVPLCDCHALIQIVPTGLLTEEGHLWRFDFHDVRWSVPGNMDVLFTLHPTPEDAGFSLVGINAPAKYRFHLLNEKGVPTGLEPQRNHPLTIPIQVWAHRTQ